MSKLTDEQIEDIRAMHSMGLSQSLLAREFGVSRSTIQNYLRGYQIRRKTTKEARSEITRDKLKQLAKESYERISRKYA